METGGLQIPADGEREIQPVAFRVYEFAYARDSNAAVFVDQPFWNRARILPSAVGREYKAVAEEAPEPGFKIRYRRR